MSLSLPWTFVACALQLRELIAWTAVCLPWVPHAGLSWSRSGPLDPGALAGWTDEQLVTHFQEGHRLAFEVLVRRYQNVAFTVCKRYLRNPEAAEETAQEVFISLFRKLHEFRGESSFKSWFYKVLTNHCHNRHKAGVRRREKAHDSIDTPEQPDDDKPRTRELSDLKLSPEEALEERQRQAILEKALEGVGEEARMILLLREGQGMAYEEIGEALQLNAGTVKSRLHRARAELKERVDRLMGLARPARDGI
ncbi:MAG: RNA polymerase sigma factor [Myxococcota bacterium]